MLDNLLTNMKFVLHGMGMLRINLSNKKNKVSYADYSVIPVHYDVDGSSVRPKL